MNKFNNKNKIITIFGLAGTGTSTCGKLLAEKLGYNFLSTGSLVREMATERGLDLIEFEDLMKQDKKFDLKLDEKISEIGKMKRERGLVIDSRLAWYFIPHSYKIKFECDDVVRIDRVVKREGVNFQEAKGNILYREKIHRNKYKELYGIDNYEIDQNFDFIINTSKLTPEQIIRRMCLIIDNL